MCDLSVRDLVHEVGGRLSLGAMPPLDGDLAPVGRIVTDSRQIEPGDVFWALKGPNHDGSDYADEAFVRGAAGVVVAARHVEPWAGRWSLQVEDGQRALWQLAASQRYRFAGRVVAVTGSVGKTTTRQMIHEVLGRRFEGSASPQNFNNHIGVPLSILGWDLLDEYAVLELGASAPGEIDALAGLCHPQIGVITCVGEAHLGGFGSRQSIAESKAELIAALPSDGLAILGGDDPWLRRMAARTSAKVEFVGRTADCDLVATHVTSRRGWLTFDVDGETYKTPVWGRHYLTSALAAIAVGRAWGMRPRCMAAALAEFTPPPQRCQVKHAGELTIIDDTYNASPTAMRAALELLRDIEGSGRRVVVCGDMAELGATSHEWHQQLGEQIVSVCGADLLVACGEHAAEVVDAARHAGMAPRETLAFATADDALEVLRKHLQAGDIVLVKGSRIMALERIVTTLADDTNSKAA